MVLGQPLCVHLMAEGTWIASVVVEGFVTEIYTGSFQHTGIGDQAVLSYDNAVGKSEQVFLQEVAPKQLVPQVGGDTEHKISAKIDHVGIDGFGQLFFRVETCRKRNVAVLLTARHDRREIAVDDVSAGFAGSSTHSAVHVRGDPVVAVYESDVLPAAYTETFLPGSGMTAVGLMETADSRMRRCILVTENRGIVCGAVIDQNDLIICEVLCKNTVETVGQIFVGVINRYDDA